MNFVLLWQNTDIPENVPRFLKNAFHILEERHLGLASLHIVGNLMSGPRSAVGNVSDYRCVSDCRSRGREFDPGPVPFVEIDHKIISTVILLPSPDLFKKGCCQLQAKVCAQITG